MSAFLFPGVLLYPGGAARRSRTRSEHEVPLTRLPRGVQFLIRSAILIINFLPRPSGATRQGPTGSEHKGFKD